MIINKIKGDSALLAILQTFIPLNFLVGTLVIMVHKWFSLYMYE
jgi:hypothetical protein